MKIVIVIPARLKSTRLPNKPLVDIAGKSLIQRTYEQCVKAVDPSLVYVATDHKLIEAHCNELGINVVMTSETCLTGTDRVAEFAEKVDADYYINVQGDEPLMNPDDILNLIKEVEASPSKDVVFNGYAPIDNKEDFFSRSVPKVVFNEDNDLMYMSRAPIPGSKQGRFEEAYRQICVYAFPKLALKTFASRKTKTKFEEKEDIEILRFLEMGIGVKLVPLSAESIAVDHPEDIDKVIAKLNE